MKTQSRSWFEARAVSAGNAELSIYDEIGAYGVTAKDFDTQVRALGRVTNLDLRINSPGGDVFAGNAIFNMLERMKANGTTITVYVDGLAASMASLIAMAGDQVVMPANAMLMIHNPSGGVTGTSAEMKQWADVLDRLKQSMVAAYSRKSGQTPGTIAGLMDEESWFTAEESVALGFADIIEKPAQVAATFDLHRYMHPPAEEAATVGERLDAIGDAISARQRRAAGLKPLPPFATSAPSLADQAVKFAATQKGGAR